MEFIAIFRDKHYHINESSQIKATLQAFEMAKKDFDLESANLSDFTIIQPTDYITVYGEALDLKSETVTCNGKTYSIYDKEYLNMPKERICKAKTIYYHNGKRYEITKD